MRLRDVMWRFKEDRAPTLVLACPAVEPQMAHPPAFLRGFLRGLTDARCPPDLDAPRPKGMAEWAALGPVFEKRNGHSPALPGTPVSHTGRTLVVARIAGRSDGSLLHPWQDNVIWPGTSGDVSLPGLQRPRNPPRKVVGRSFDGSRHHPP